VTLRPARTILVACGEPALTERVVQEISLLDPKVQAPYATTVTHAISLLERYEPDVILVDETAVCAGEEPIDEVLAPLTERAPVVFIGDPVHQEILTVLIGCSAVDMVARVGNFASVAAGLVERRLQQSELKIFEESTFIKDFGERLRHEVNNPLTGILGNAQLLMTRAQREGMPVRTIERLQTIAELAMRLRETVRVLSQNWDDLERREVRTREASSVGTLAR